MAGLSRPLVERILGGYPGEILWSTVGAKPSVRVDQFEAWIKPILATTDAGDLGQIRAEAILDDALPLAKDLDSEARTESRARAAELAKMFGKR